jgi:hypothetical protein
MDTEKKTNRRFRQIGTREALPSRGHGARPTEVRSAGKIKVRRLPDESASPRHAAKKRRS